MKDCHVNKDFYLHQDRRHAIPAIVNNHTVRWHVEKRGDERCDVQHDNTTSNTSAHSQLNKAGGRYSGGTLKIRFVRETPDSPDFNRNDLGLCNSLWSWVSKESEMKMMTREQSQEVAALAFWHLPAKQFEILSRTQLEI